MKITESAWNIKLICRQYSDVCYIDCLLYYRTLAMQVHPHLHKLLLQVVIQNFIQHQVDLVVELLRLVAERVKRENGLLVLHKKVDLVEVETHIHQAPTQI